MPTIILTGAAGASKGGHRCSDRRQRLEDPQWPNQKRQAGRDGNTERRHDKQC